MVIFGSVVFKEACQYIDDFLDSLNKQTYKDFVLLLMYEGYERDEVQKLLINYNNLQDKAVLVKSNSNSSIANNRIEMLENAVAIAGDDLENSLLILGDCDDAFEMHRVEEIVEIYSNHKEYAFFYNELRLFEGSVLMPHMPTKTANIKDISKFNYLGLTNTAINMMWLSEQFFKELRQNPNDVFDWYFFSLIMINGGRGIKVDNTYTLYRTYIGNMAGVNKLELSKLKKEHSVKIRHYERLKNKNVIFEELYDYYNGFKDDEELLRNSSYSEFWWGMIGDNEK